MRRNSIRAGFICNHCRITCGNCTRDDYHDYPRKIDITCLGQYCDEPCEFQKEKTDVTLKMALDKVSYLTEIVNKLLKEKYHE